MQFPFEVSYMRAFLADLLLHISIQKLTHSMACAWEPTAAAHAAVGRAGRRRRGSRPPELAWGTWGATAAVGRAGRHSCGSQPQPP